VVSDAAVVDHRLLRDGNHLVAPIVPAIGGVIDHVNTSFRSVGTAGTEVAVLRTRLR
jgi:hypothetical protein